MFKRISKVLLALILATSLVTEPVAIAMAVESNMPAVAVINEDVASDEDTSGDDTFEDEIEETLVSVEIDKINVDYNKSVILQWTPVEGTAVYVERSITGEEESWSEVAGPLTGTSYTDKGIQYDKTYFYRLKTVSKADNTKFVYSEAVKIDTKKIPLSAVALNRPSVSVGKIVISWKAVKGATAYNVYRKTTNGNWIYKTTVKAGNTLSYTDKNVGSRVKYSYKVIPKNNYYTGTKYSSVTVYSKLKSTKVSVAARSKNYITVKWTKVSNANVYRVYRSTDGKNWTYLKETKSFSYKATNLKAKKKYYFKVRAYCRSNGKNLDYTDSASIKTSTRYNGPSRVVVRRGKTTATISWTKVTGANKYVVYMSSDGGKTYKKIYTGTKRKISKGNVSEKRTYRFAVYAVDVVSGMEMYSFAHIEKSLAPKYNNFQMIGLDSNKFLKMLKARSKTNYYLGTPYGSIKDDPNVKVTEAGFTRPNGMKTKGKKRMNCAGFIGSIMRDAGADLTAVRQSGYSYGTANACNWVTFFNNSDVKKYKYRSVKSLLASGKARKGDIICRVPDKFDKEKNHDYHMMVFWGNNGKHNRMWHSTFQGGRSCNQISPLYEQSYECTYYLIKLTR